MRSRIFLARRSGANLWAEFADTTAHVYSGASTTPSDALGVPLAAVRYACRPISWLQAMACLCELALLAVRSALIPRNATGGNE